MNNTTTSDTTGVIPQSAGKTTRRQALKGLGLGALGLTSLNLLSSKAEAATTSVPLTLGDINLLNFALNLEYLEAEYYTYATTGAGIQAQGVSVGGAGRAGNVIIKADPTVFFGTPAIQQYALEIAADERAHVNYIRQVLGPFAVARPTIDLQHSFNAAARAAGIIGAGDTFDPFGDELAFLVGAFIFEDVGVTAYRGAAPLLVNKTVLSAAAGILGTEAYHASNIRTKIFEAGEAGQAAAQKISDLRNALDGAGDQDQGVVLDGMANITPTNTVGMVFTRTTRQVLNIVYLAQNAKKGGFFPNGIN